MSNRFDNKFNKPVTSDDGDKTDNVIQEIKNNKISEKKEENKTRVSTAASILNAGVGNSLDINNIKIPEKKSKYTASYYMREDIHQKINEFAEANNLKPSAFLEELLKQVFGLNE